MIVQAASADFARRADLPDFPRVKATTLALRPENAAARAKNARAHFSGTVKSGVAA